MIRIIICLRQKISTNHLAPLYSIAKTKTLRGILTSRISFDFSKVKKEKPQIRSTSIHISKLNEELDGFVLYQNKEGAKISAITIAFIVCFVSAYWTYRQIEDDQIKINYMIMGALLFVPFLIFQLRAAKTLKRLVLDKQGENIVLTRFTLGGFGEQSTKGKVEYLRGIGKAFVFGGSVIKGGGVHGLE